MVDYARGILVIEDDIKINTICFIKHILSKVKSNSTQVMCVEKEPQKWITLLREDVKIIHFDNPKEWKNSVITLWNTFNIKTTLIIDSINQLSSLIGWDHCLKFLQQLKENIMVENVIIVFHNDCLLNGSIMIKHLRYISHTYITFSLDTDIYQVNITTNTIGGKVKKLVERINYDAGSNKWVTADIKKFSQDTDKEKECQPADITSFKISVDDAAQAVKNKMILPYTEIGKTEGKIIYHHDAGDDWDDEDPDDDLDI